MTKQKEAAYQAQHKEDKPQADSQATETSKEEPITGKVIESPMPGSILQVLVKAGDSLAKGQPVVILEAMKMENSITSDYAGTVKRVFAKEGTTVSSNAPLITVGKQNMNKEDTFFGYPLYYLPEKSRFCFLFLIFVRPYTDRTPINFSE